MVGVEELLWVSKGYYGSRRVIVGRQVTRLSLPGSQCLTQVPVPFGPAIGDGSSDVHRCCTRVAQTQGY